MHIYISQAMTSGRQKNRKKAAAKNLSACKFLWGRKNRQAACKKRGKKDMWHKAAAFAAQPTFMAGKFPA